MTNKSLIILLFMAISMTNNAQINITPGGSPSDILSALIGQGLTASNVTITSPTNAYGTFTNGSATTVGINNGLIMTTGSAVDVAGANNSDSSSTCNGTILMDADLTNLDPLAYEDVSIIEFDIIPKCDQLSIKFVFGSEEYPEYVGSGYNDAFGFFITGPNPGGGNYTSYNIARVSNSTPVTINTINANTNSSFYIDNANGSTIQYDGLTTQIVSAVNLVPCATYHFKLAIADAGDCEYDSGIFVDFLQCSNVTTLATSATASSCVSPDGTATVVVTNGFPPFTYTWSPAPPQGQGTASVSGLSPGTTYTVEVDDSYDCITPISDSITIPFANNLSLSVNSGTICAGESINLTATPSIAGGIYLWSEANQTSQTVTVSPLTSTTYTANYTLGLCTATANTLINVNPAPSPTIEATKDEVVFGEQVTLTVDGAGTYLWSTGETAASITVSPSDTTTYCVVVENSNGCKTEVCGEIKVTCFSSLHLPNCFTPNGDLVNDLCYFNSTCIESFHLQILNRWGELVFESFDTNNSWDGTYKNKEVVDGVYTYLLQAQGLDKKHYKEQGFITVLK